MRVLIADKFETEGLELLEKLGCEVRLDPELEPPTLPAALAEHRGEVLIVRSTKVPRPVLESAGELRLIVRAGAGFDNIDWRAAGELGIAVCNCPGMNSTAVAELAMGLLIACDRRIPQQTAELKAGHWYKKEYSKARGLLGRTLLVIGRGAIGREVSRRAQAFGMHLLVFEPTLTPQWAREIGIELVAPTREDLLDAAARADAVTIHVPLIDQTRGMCDAEFFGRMKPGAIIVNTSRGPIIDEPALLDAVKTKGIRAGLDVYCDQPAEKDCNWCPALAEHPNVITTHHVGASTDQAQIAVAEETARIVRVYRDAGTFENCVNAETLRAPAHA